MTMEHIRVVNPSKEVAERVRTISIKILEGAEIAKSYHEFNTAVALVMAHIYQECSSNPAGSADNLAAAIKHVINGGKLDAVQ